MPMGHSGSSFSSSVGQNFIKRVCRRLSPWSATRPGRARSAPQLQFLARIVDGEGLQA